MITIKNQKEINHLFRFGKITIIFPLMVYCLEAKEPKVLFSISKKKINKAVDRNKIKRQLKDIYSKDLSWNVKKHIAFVYIADNICDYNTLYTSMNKIKNAYKDL